MRLFNIAVPLLALKLFSPTGVSGLKRGSSSDKSFDKSFLQIKSNLPDPVQQPLAAQNAPVQATDPEGLKKAVAATVLANQAAQLQNGAVSPPDFTTPSLPVTSAPVVAPVVDTFPQTPTAVPDLEPEFHLNVLLDPSLTNISEADKHVKAGVERAVHSLKKALEAFTNLTALLSSSQHEATFLVEGDEFTVKTTLDLMNRVLKQNEAAQKVLFQANAFVLSSLTKSATSGTKASDKTL